ncbi:periplasmic binding protein-like II [Piromyces finnis]|uniref:Periplasmic binding protein-like II n=1 Tax=Piromyces finnis TaxID=1754191 RepID=A0A1Y1VKA9_9FUNG|nr:periplasmic binding protein-like II [Piromyces finnis]|eukprot:ORX57945.1 periplasmic binding protein-like II [Piromyces finnis]
MILPSYIKHIKIILNILYIFLFTNIVKADNIITVSAITFSYQGEDNIYSILARDFNRYAKNNNINIRLDLNLITSANSTLVANDYGLAVDTLLSKKSDKYDIYFYNNIYTEKLAKHFIDLKKSLPKEHMDMYDSQLNKDICVAGDKWASLPIKIDFTSLYSNVALLAKYNRTIPKTWDELEETGKIVLENEKDDEEEKLCIFNGSLNFSEIGTCSILEFIHSYRESINSPYPGLASDEAVKALEKIKEIKNTISSDEVFQNIDYFVINKLYGNRALFLKYWYYDYPPIYKRTLIPGRTNQTSAACIGGFNVAASIYSSQVKQQAALKVIEYITSKDVHLKYVKKYDYLTGIADVYNDEEVCSYIDCDMYKKIQPVIRPTKESEDYDKYSTEFKNKIYEYLYGNLTAKEALQNALDLSKIYSVGISDDSIGLTFYIILWIIIAIIVCSSVFIFIPPLKPYIKFLPKDFWIISIIGIIMMHCVGFAEFGEMTTLKCYYRVILMSFGFTLSFIPPLYKLIISFPEENKVSKWIENHRYIFLLIFLCVDVGMNLLLNFYPYKIKFIRIVDGQNFQYCDSGNSLNKVIIFSLCAFKALIFLSFFLLIFLEWSLKNIYYDIRFLITALYIDLIDIILLVMVTYLNINNYKVNFVIRLIICILYSISTFVFLYGYRIIHYLLSNRFNRNSSEENMNNLIHNLRKFNDNKAYSTSDANTINNKSFATNSTNTKGTSKIISKVLSYHNAQGINQGTSQNTHSSVCYASKSVESDTL